MPSGTLTKRVIAWKARKNLEMENQFMENFKITRPPYRGQTSYER